MSANGLDEALSELAVLEAVISINLPVDLHERLTNRRIRSWRASINVHPVKYDDRWPFELPDIDPDYNASPPRGVGATRKEALDDLLRALRRITFGLIAVSDPGTGGTVMVQIAWTKHGLRPVEQPTWT